jgi:hypothetical protein
MEIFNLVIHHSLWPRACALTFLFAATLGLAPQLLAQQGEQSSAPATTQIQSKPATDAGADQAQPVPAPQPPKDDRIFFALPNLLTVENASSAPPLSTGQMFKLVAQGTFDPVEFAFLGIESGVNQASNTNPTFGQGLKGYGKRYALAFADNTVENFMTGAIYPSLLRQDPRYYQLGKGSFLHRAAYAGLRVLITRSDSGKTQFNFSEILGAGSAAAISNAYHPGPRTLGSNLNVWGTQIGWDAVGYEMKEFWPDIHRYLVRHHQKT